MTYQSLIHTRCQIYIGVSWSNRQCWVYSTFGGGRCEIRVPDGCLIGKIPKSGGVYQSPHISPVSTALAGVWQVSLDELHRRMGHIDVHAVRDLVKHGAIDGVVLTGNIKDFECCVCKIAKACRKSVPKIQEGEWAVEISGEIHSDLWGPATKLPSVADYIISASQMIRVDGPQFTC